MSLFVFFIFFLIEDILLLCLFIVITLINKYRLLFVEISGPFQYSLIMLLQQNYGLESINRVIRINKQHLGTFRGRQKHERKISYNSNTNLYAIYEVQSKHFGKKCNSYCI